MAERHSLIPVASAGIIYAVLVFLAGFVLGTMRVLPVIPNIGETAAVSLEAPMILAVSWFVSGWCVDRLDVPRTLAARFVMGVVAFIILMAAEAGLAVVVFGRSAAAYLASYGSASGIIGLVAQVVFALFPVVQVWRR